MNILMPIIGIIGLALICWVFVSPCFLIFYYYSNNKISKLAILCSRYYFPLVFGSFIFFSITIGLGLIEVFSFIPDSWGFVNDEGEYQSYREYVSYLLGVVASFGILYLLEGGNSLKEENRRLIEEIESMKKAGRTKSKKRNTASGPLGKKKPQNALDGSISATYGNPSPAKRANVGQAIEITKELLQGVVDENEINRQAIALNDSPTPYSTHDLALSIALNFFRQQENIPRLFETQLFARRRMLDWLEEGLVAPLLVKSFEDVLSKLYKQPAAVTPKPLEREEYNQEFNEIRSRWQTMNAPGQFGESGWIDYLEKNLSPEGLAFYNTQIKQFTRK